MWHALIASCFVNRQADGERRESGEHGRQPGRRGRLLERQRLGSHAARRGQGHHQAQVGESLTRSYHVCACVFCASVYFLPWTYCVVIRPLAQSCRQHPLLLLISVRLVTRTNPSLSHHPARKPLTTPRRRQRRHRQQQQRRRRRLATAVPSCPTSRNRRP